MLATATGRSLWGGRRDKRDIRSGCASHSTPQTLFSRLRPKLQLQDPDEIVGAGRYHEGRFDLRAFAMACLAYHTKSIDPAEEFFDSLTLDCVDTTTGMAGVRSVDRRVRVCIALRDMRCNAKFAPVRHELWGIIILVATHYAAGPSIVFENIERGLALCYAFLTCASIKVIDREVFAGEQSFELRQVIASTNPRRVCADHPRTRRSQLSCSIRRLPSTSYGTHATAGPATSVQGILVAARWRRASKPFDARLCLAEDARPRNECRKGA